MSTKKNVLTSLLLCLLVAGCSTPYVLTPAATAEREKLSPALAMRQIAQVAQEKDGYRGFCGLKANYGITPQLDRINNAVLSFQIQEAVPGRIDFVGTDRRVNWVAPATPVTLAVVNSSIVQREGTFDLKKIRLIQLIEKSQWHKWWCSPDKAASQGYLVRIFDSTDAPKYEVLYFNVDPAALDAFLAALTYFSPSAKVEVPSAW